MSGDSLVVIGNFDGVHRGHQMVLDALCRIARSQTYAPKVLTFEPHPAVTLGRRPPALLTSLERKKELMDRACPGVEVVVCEFTKEFASKSPEEFVQQVLVDQLGARAVMVGENFRFGRDRSGDVAALHAFGAKHGFETLAEPLASDAQGPWSSTRVRKLIAVGDVEAALEVLGRPHMLSGTVVMGARRGRQLGFPTCNISDAPETLPAYGVYAVLVDRVADGAVAALAKGVVNIGVRPTVDETASKPLVETHLFDYDGDLYGAHLRIHLVTRLRAEKRFSGLDALKAQIAADGARAREVLADFQQDDGVGWF